MKKVLLISGFFSHPDDVGLDIYCTFNLFFMSSKYELTIFRYRTSEPLESVYERLEKEIPNYSIILAHSMGGCLLMHYLQKHPIVFKLSRKTKYIFMMPFIQRSMIMKVISHIPSIEDLKLFKPLFLPNSKIVSTGNILNEKFEFIPIHQVQYAYKNLLYSDDDIIKVLNSSRVYLFYATDEKITNISENILNKVKNKQFIDGKHAAFADASSIFDFFNYLSKLI